jgi:DNA-binding SARP family transcriptional activator
VIELRVLGGVELHDGAREDLEGILAQPKRLALLVYLCLAGRGGFVRRDTLLALFWPETDVERARAALNQSLYFLRRALGTEVLPARGGEEVGVDLTRLCCDALQFEDAAASNDRARALELYAGELLPALFVEAPEFDQWLAGERVSIRNQALELALDLADDAGRDTQEAASWFRRALEISPESERAALGLVRSLWHERARTSALEAFASFAERLEADYGLQPGVELRELAERVRRGEEAPIPDRQDTEAPPFAAQSDRLQPDQEASSDTRSSSRERTWLRVLLPYGLGIATIVLIGMWVGRFLNQENRAWFEAEREYRKAWAAWESLRYDSAQAYLTSALEADSTHAPAWALLAYTSTMLNTRNDAPAGDVLTTAYRAAKRAITLDDTLAAAWTARAVIQWAYLADWSGAERDYRRTLELSTGGTWEAIARADLSALLADLGRCDEAWEIIEPYALSEPLDRTLGSTIVIRIPYLCHDLAGTIREAELAAAVGDPSPKVLEYLFLGHLLNGDLEAAEAAARGLRSALPDHPYHMFPEALLEARRGNGVAADSLVREMETVGLEEVFEGLAGSPTEPAAKLYAAVGDTARAYRLLLAEMNSKGHVRRLTSDPLFEPLRDDPRYLQLTARMKLRCRRGGGRQSCQPIE